MKNISFPIFLVICVGFLLSENAFAQGSGPVEVTDDQVNAIAKYLYCPVCENVPLDVCGTQACAQWRELVRQKLAEGWTEAQIRQYFVDQYGYRALSVPPPKGFNWLVYVIPPLIILVGLFFVYRTVLTWKTPLVKNEVNPPNDDLPKAYVAQIEEELRK